MLARNGVGGLPLALAREFSGSTNPDEQAASTPLFEMSVDQNFTELPAVLEPERVLAPPVQSLDAGRASSDGTLDTPRLTI